MTSNPSTATPCRRIDHTSADRSTGCVTMWHETGAKACEMEHVAGVAHGRYATWAADGTPREQGRYARGLRHGTWITWLADGRMSSMGDWFEGARHGAWTWWAEDGSRVNGRYRHDQADGDWLYHDRAGNVVRGEQWDRGRCVRALSFGVPLGR